MANVAIAFHRNMDTRTPGKISNAYLRRTDAPARDLRQVGPVENGCSIHTGVYRNATDALRGLADYIGAKAFCVIVQSVYDNHDYVLSVVGYMAADRTCGGITDHVIMRKGSQGTLWISRDAGDYVAPAGTWAA